MFTKSQPRFMFMFLHARFGGGRGVGCCLPVQVGRRLAHLQTRAEPPPSAPPRPQAAAAFLPCFEPPVHSRYGAAAAVLEANTGRPARAREAASAAASWRSWSVFPACFPLPSSPRNPPNGPSQGCRRRFEASTQLPPICREGGNLLHGRARAFGVPRVFPCVTCDCPPSPAAGLLQSWPPMRTRSSA